MALTETEQIPLNFPAPYFELPDPRSGKSVNTDDVMQKNGLVVMFICNHCPYVVHVREELVRLAHDYLPREIGFVAISSNDVGKYPDDRPELMAQLAAEMDFPFPYLYDETQEVAKAYRAACTPDFSVFNGDGRCVYRGRLDASSPGNGKPVTGHDMRACLDALLEDGRVLEDQIPSMGCNIKWKM